MRPELIEAAARELCRMRGVDPDRPMGIDFERGAGGFTEVRKVAWQRVAPEVERFAQVGQAIASALALPGKKRKTNP